jgi:hypothetical protein
MEYFNSMDFLEPKCRACGSVIEYGITTEFKDDIMSHICLSCGSPI